MIEWIQDNQVVLFGVPFVLALLGGIPVLKPEWLRKTCQAGGVVVSKLLIKRLGKKSGQALENFIQIRLKASFEGFMKGLDLDDQKDK